MKTKLLFLAIGMGWAVSAAGSPAFPLKLSENRRHLVDQEGQPFFVMGDTPWFMQKLKIEDVRMLMDDRQAKGCRSRCLRASCPPCTVSRWKPASPSPTRQSSTAPAFGRAT